MLAKTPEQPVPHRLFGHDFLAAGLVFLVALVVYLATLYPTCPGGDSGELIAAAHTLGIAHPPGYPLYTLLGKLFSLIPLRTIAWRLNLMSAFFDALAAGILCLTVTRWRNNVWAGVLAGGIFAFAPLTWTYAVAAEVFALNNFFITVLLLLCVLYMQSADSKKRGKVVCFSAFWAGLGLSNHHTFAIYAAPVLFWLFWRERRLFLNPSGIAWIAGLFVLGLLPYAYLPIAASHFPTVAWGDLTTLKGFLTHVFRLEYGTFRAGSTTTYGENYGFFEHVASYFSYLVRECYWAGVPFALFGAITSVRQIRSVSKDRCELTFAWLLIFIFAAYLMIFCALSNIPMHVPLYRGIQARFWQQSNILIYLWIGFGFAALFRYFRRYSHFLAIICLTLILFAVGIRYKEQDQSENWTFRDFSRASFQFLPERAVLLASGDCAIYPLLYFHTCEGLRPDVIFVPEPLLVASWAKRNLGSTLAGFTFPDERMVLNDQAGPGEYTLKALLDANTSHQIYTTGVDMDRNTLETYRLAPAGMNALVLPKRFLPDWAGSKQRITDAELSFGLFDPAKAARYRDDTWEHEAFRGYWEMRYFFGIELLDYSIRHGGHDPDMLKKALQSLESFASGSAIHGFTNGVKETDLYRSIGLGYWLLSRQDRGAVQGMARAWGRFLELAAPDNPDVPKIRAALASKMENK